MPRLLIQFQNWEWCAGRVVSRHPAPETTACGKGVVAGGERGSGQDSEWLGSCSREGPSVGKKRHEKCGKGEPKAMHRQPRHGASDTDLLVGL